MKNNSGIENFLPRMREELQKYPEISSAVLFGSRAKGNFRHNSDVDIALKGDVLLDTLLTLKTVFESLFFPYRFDLLSYKNIANEALKSHVDRVGIEIYIRKE